MVLKIDARRATFVENISKTTSNDAFSSFLQSGVPLAHSMSGTRGRRVDRPADIGDLGIESPFGLDEALRDAGPEEQEGRPGVTDVAAP